MGRPVFCPLRKTDPRYPGSLSCSILLGENRALVWSIRKSALAGPCVGIVIAQDLMGSAPLHRLRPSGQSRFHLMSLENLKEMKVFAELSLGSTSFIILKQIIKAKARLKWAILLCANIAENVFDLALQTPIEQQPGCLVARCLEQRVETVGVQSVKTQMESEGRCEWDAFASMG